MNDETNWRGKPLFQLRSMAQTRACAKALRNVLAFVPVLAGYEATPAEEMVTMGSSKAAQDVAQQKIADYQAKQEAKVKVNLPAVNSPSKTENELKESIKKAEEKDAYPLVGALGDVQRKKGPKANYMAVTLLDAKNKEVHLNLFDNHNFQDGTRLWDLLEMAKGRFVSFLVKDSTNPKYNATALRLLKLHNMEFGEDGEIKGVAGKRNDTVADMEAAPKVVEDDLSEYAL